MFDSVENKSAFMGCRFLIYNVTCLVKHIERYAMCALGALWTPAG